MQMLFKCFTLKIFNKRSLTMNENLSRNYKQLPAQSLGTATTKNVHILISQVQSFFDALLYFKINPSSEKQEADLKDCRILIRN